MSRLARRSPCRRVVSALIIISCAILVFLWLQPVDTILAHHLYYHYAHIRISIATWWEPRYSPKSPQYEAERTPADNATTTLAGIHSALIGDTAVFSSTKDNCLTHDNRYHTMEDDMASQSWLRNGQTEQTSRTAIVLRAWGGFIWTDDDILNVQTMVSEMSALGPAYEVFILLHLREGDVLQDAVPSSLQNITKFWKYDECREAYPEVKEHDFYFHAFMGLQLFAETQPEIDFFWNWEMDTRYTGHYNDLFPSLTDWADAQDDNKKWQYNTRFYIPSVHGTYDDFRHSILALPTPNPLPSPWVDQSHVPTKSFEDGADLITLFPIFDTSYTIWPWKDHLVNYRLSEVTPRFASVGTNVRLSRRMLNLMASENKAGRAMASEMWPSTLAYHHGLKAVYVPHPIYLDTKVAPDSLQAIFNGGKDGTVGGGWSSVINQERAFVNTTWYWNAELPLRLYRLWKDSPADLGKELCLPPMLLHPVKGDRL